MKRKFYIVESYQRKGPYNIEELKKYGITKDTLIWAFEFDSPQKAGDIAELSEIFSQNISEDKEEQKKINSTENTTNKNIPELSDEELLKQYEEIKKQEEKKKEKIPASDEKLSEKTEKEDQTLNINSKEEEKIDKEENNDEIKIEGNINKEPEEYLLESSEEKKEESQTIIIEKKTEQTYSNVEYEATIGPKDIPEKPKNYILWSVLALILCCSPLAIVSLITGSQVEKKYNEGDYAGAEKSSKTSLTILIISIILSIIGVLITFIFNYNQ